MISALEKLPLFKKIQEPVNSKLNKKALSKFTLEPMDHQKDFFTVYDANTQRFNLKGYVLAAVPGSGKTLMGLFLSEMLETTTTIIFSPNNALQRVWKDTFDTRYHSTPSYYIYGDNKEPTGKERYLVFNHENLKFAFETLKKVIKKGTKINIVVDECHAFNEMKSDRTKLLILMIKNQVPFFTSRFFIITINVIRRRTVVTSIKGVFPYSL
jgi:superfamily II DNA or RNA helicase